ncbi:MAG: hypothetical protein QOJ69_1699 [Actinomycetota bacterium]|nr:hypothetical protein [Actinomycetota bacterium]
MQVRRQCPPVMQAARHTRRAATGRITLDPSSLLRLQATAGNRAVSGLLGRPVVQRSPGTDVRWVKDERAARYRGGLIAKRITTHTKVSSDVRAKIKQERAYFQGSARDVYNAVIEPALTKFGGGDLIELRVPTIKPLNLGPGPLPGTGFDADAFMEDIAAENLWDLLTGRRVLAKGEMRWKLGPPQPDAYGNQKGTTRWAQIAFKPSSPVAGRTISFLQTKLQKSTGGPPKGAPELDVLPDEFEPFYGAKWDAGKNDWVAEGAHDKFKNRPSSASHPAAYLFDDPSAPPGQAKLFESVATVVETGETLGALRWGVGEATDTVECTDAPKASFGAAVDTFYAAPPPGSGYGPGYSRKENYDATVGGFMHIDKDDFEVELLSTGQERQLDPVLATIKAHPDANVEVAGFADETEADPPATSATRARAVESYLVRQGVKADHIHVTAYGARWGRAGADEARNRRVQVRLTGG